MIYKFIIVTICGDTTSDEATTETDGIQVPIIAPISTVQHLSSSTRRNIRLNVLFRNIPHCVKWRCIHNHCDKGFTDNDEKYLTSTQQRFKEIHHLRKQLKLTLVQLENKDLHLNELRDQSCDLESVEAVDARAEMMKLQIALKQQKEVKVKIEVKDAEVMTETADNILHCSELSRISSSFPPSPQAYENEAMAWQMKAAQLEMVLKDQIFKIQQGITPKLGKCRNENEHLRMYIKNMGTNITNHTMIDSGFELKLNPILTTNIANCYSQHCLKNNRWTIINEKKTK
ncbi:unnamed protein product [Wuchereria bancrofti]|uniref:Uncharacterized protein n=1 Tax=Wuchereria bancrofti TaxID=6293 RepID=A0A3P7EB87_WUCBA|nr:unnamed protein product [Wuchereria bancrofti]